MAIFSRSASHVSRFKSCMTISPSSPASCAVPVPTFGGYWTPSFSNLGMQVHCSSAGIEEKTEGKCWPQPSQVSFSAAPSISVWCNIRGGRGQKHTTGWTVCWSTHFEIIEGVVGWCIKYWSGLCRLKFFSSTWWLFFILIVVANYSQ